MRKHLIFILLMSLQMVAHGQTMAVLDSLGLPRPTVAKSMRYWFDDDAGSVTSSSIHNSHHIIDVSALAEGLHTINYQIIDDKGSIGIPYSSVFLKLSDIHDQTGSAVEAKKLIYWFDEQEARKINDINGDVQMLDASALQEGMHTLHYMVVCSDGSITSAYSSIFLSLNVDRISGTSESINAKSLRYWFDENDIITETKLINGTQSLDVSNLSYGFHMLHYQIIDNRGEVGVTVSSPFIKLYMDEEKGNAITRYMYWLNDKSVDNVKVNIDEPTSPYQLISLLPMPKAPIRSSSFHFEPKNGEPMIYAKNDVHFRFFDAAGYWGDEARSYIDYNVSQKVTGVAELASTQTFERPEENGIKWFEFEAEEGDSIGFYCNQATSLQVFAPSGEEIYSVAEYESVKYGGVHTWEDGTHYVAVHDVTGSRPSVTLNYMHMDKFDVVGQDVRVVGNGGCSTITFQGNGFKNLYAVDLYTANGDSIHSIDIGHESDASTSVTFDFTDAELGKCNAVFHFTEEDKVFVDILTVEEAKEIELAVNVVYPSSFLRGTSATYTVNITNKGNMTAYYVPTYIYLKNKDRHGISSVEIKGLDLPSLTEGLDTEVLPESSVSYFESIVEQYKDDLRFIKGWQIDPDTGDTISVRVCDAYICIAPQTTLSFSIDIKSTDDVFLNVSIPREWKAIAADSQKGSRLRKVSGNDIVQQYCCYKERIECVLDYASITCDVVSPILGFISNFVPEAKVASLAVALAGCNVSIKGDQLKAFGESLCNSNEKSALLNMLKSAFKAKTAMPSLGSVLSCVGSILSGLGLPEGKAAEALNMLSNSLSAGALFNDNINLWGAQTSCSSIGTPKPNCPPNPDEDGGESTPVNSLDPNDINGYVAHSGSKYISEDVITLPYRIEFENDTTFATASAHTVIIKDTLDATKFDLSSYTPTSIKIGDKDVQLNGDKQFVTTIDMRPSINAIAQVEGTYDEKKGIATWKFTSLDPMTMEETDDVMQGFLPINFDGNGIGEVAFNIDRLPNLADGTAIHNKVSIVFDTNDAIETPVWTNTIDAIAPTSKVTDVEMKNDSTFTIHFEGADARSGIWKYDVYYRWKTDMDWICIANGCDSTAFDKTAVAGYTYQFCVVATDSAGNVEQKSLTPEFEFSTSDMLGDVNQDGKVDVTDIAIIVSIINGNALSGYKADIDNDGDVDIDDLNKLIELILKK